MSEPEGLTAARGRPPARARSRSELGFFLQLTGACGLVFARPILDAFGRAPETFLEADAGWQAIVVFAVVWVVIPPMVLWLVTFATRVFGARVRRVAHVVVLGVLAAIFTVQALFQAQDWPVAVVWVLGVAAAAIMAVLWIRFIPWREFLALLSGAPVLFLVLFLVTSPTSDLLEGDTARALTAGPHVPIVMVVLDELPTVSLLDGSGHIDPLVFPGFARLAADSTWYRNHTTTATTTDQAVPAMLTGRYADIDSVAVNSQYPQNIFTWLGGDTTMHVHETLTHLCPATICAGAPRAGIRDVVDRSVDLWQDRFHHARAGGGMFFDPIGGGETRGADFQTWINGIAKAPTSRFDFAHLVLPHTPWDLTPTGRRYDPGADVGESPYYYQWAGDEAARFNRERHLAQLQYTDHLIQELLARLDALGTYDDSLVVVTADHGAAFSGDVPVRAPTPRNLTQIAWSPLFVKAPHQRAGRIDDRNAENIDVLPTIAALTGTHLPWRVDGRSLTGRPRRSPVKHLVRPVAQNQVPLDASGRIRIDGRPGFRKVLRFAPATIGSDAYAFFRGGPAGVIVGKPASAVPAGTPSDAHVTLDPGGLEVDAGDGPIPIVVRATLDDAPPDTVLALLVNQTIVGTYRPTRDHKARWVVPETALHVGHNDVALATVTGRSGRETLHPLSTG
jgi:Sulfatase